MSAVDFASPTRGLRRLPWLGWTLVVIALANAAVAMWLTARWQSEIEGHSAASVRSAGERTELARVVAEQSRRTARQLEDSAEIAKLREPWLKALRQIEAATGTPILLVSISLAKPARLFRLEAESPSYPEALDYVSRLSAGEQLIDAQLTSHESASDGTGRKFVKFAVSATWGQP